MIAVTSAAAAASATASLNLITAANLLRTQQIDREPLQPMGKTETIVVVGLTSVYIIVLVATWVVIGQMIIDEIRNRL